MGWTSYHVEPTYNPKAKKYTVDRKAECDRLFNQDMVTYNDDKVIGKFEVIKSYVVGSTYYAAVKRTKFATETEPEDSCVFAAVVLTSVDNKDYHNFSYKDMDETVGPYQYSCPKSILDLLSPTDNEYANAWRERCYEVLKAKKNPNALGNLPIGSQIKYVNHKGEEVVLFKHPAAYQFKRPFWMCMDQDKYVSPKHIPSNYEVIKRGA
jgi:hypothetical protein